MGYVYIALTIIFTVYGQLVLKWRMNLKGAMPEPLGEKVLFLSKAFIDPWLLSGLCMAFVASIAWMAAMTKLDLSHAYPFMSLNFVAVLLASGWILNEPINLQKVVGVGLIILGTVTAARG